MIDERFVLVGAAFNIIGSFVYIYHVLQGKAKPNRVSWFLWAFAPLIAFAAQRTAGIGWQSILTFVVGFSPLMVFISSFLTKKAYWRITRFDLFCGAISVIALVLWLATGKGLLAIMLSIVADLMAGIPTLTKTWRAPETEHYGTMVGGTLNGAITLLTVRVWSPENYAFALYIFLFCLLLSILIIFRVGPKWRAHFLEQKGSA